MQDLTGSNNAASLLGMDESSNKPTAGPSPNNPTVPYVPNARHQRDSGGGSALARTLDRNQGEGYKQFEKSNADFDTKRKNAAEREELARQMHRKWKGGDTYAPHDLSYQELKKWIKPRQPSKDVIDMLGLNPLDHYKNFAMISEFMTPQGRIMHNKWTGLRPVNQRKMAKAIRRAIGMGIHPSTHRHPEIIFGREGRGPRYQNLGQAREEPANKIKVK